MHLPKLYEAPDDAFFHRVADAAGQLTYNAILHMVHLHHGCIPDHVSFLQKVWRWMCRLSLFWQQDLRKVLLNANFDDSPLIDDQWFKAGSIVHGQHQQLAPLGLQQRVYHLQTPVLHTDHEAAGSIVLGQHQQLATPSLQQRIHNLQMPVLRTDVDRTMPFFIVLQNVNFDEAPLIDVARIAYLAHRSR